MLFNSNAFLFIFLPACLTGYFLLGRASNRLAMLWLAAASFVFYAQSGAEYLLLLFASIIFNYFSGKFISRLVESGRRSSAESFTALAVCVNLGALCYYKYGGFVLENGASFLGLQAAQWNVVLPVGISFYTFTQIAFLVDSLRGRTHRAGPFEYALFVNYFPHLIAGPILHHKEMIPQFLRRTSSMFSTQNIAIGLGIFIVGLSKKILIADSVAPYSDAVFAAKGALSFGDAWIGALAYTIQIYFDFSGYCDMAVGLSKMFNIDLPLNFYSPYKADNIIEFWRRWHMTLSRFLRDYLYIPLGGSRRGALRRNINLMITMLLGGLWHGAAWTFVIWGGLHGLYLLINHAFRQYAPASLTSGIGFRVFARILTLLCVVVAWVFFRAESTDSAFRILAAMIAPGAGLVPTVPIVLTEVGYAVGGIVAGFVIALCCPNSQQMFRLPFHPVIDGVEEKPNDHPKLEPTTSLARLVSWRPSLVGALVYGLFFGVSALLFVRTTRFLYFQF